MTDDADYEVRITREVNAPPATVFAAWIDPAVVEKWFSPVKGMRVTNAVLDPVEGGRFVVVMRGNDMEFSHRGTYRTVAAPERLEFTWEAPESVGADTLVSVTVRPAGQATEIALHHSGFPSEKSAEGYRKGWNLMLETLQATIE